jgi:hypothetical protein|tara:strand:- start:222 stop:2156 length:1935 start_codon:yes stop_codon:yes gene_type:complete
MADLKKLSQVQPIAQTFQIPFGGGSDKENANFDGGAFVTSVDLFFFGKDEELPVFVELRETENGYPTTKRLPFARAVLIPSEVVTSELGDVPTTFTFESPVFILDGSEYAVVVGSNSPEYKIFIAQMGEESLLGGKLLDKQPLVGTLFKSTNDRAWAMSPMEDLKLTIRAALFDIGRTSVIKTTSDDDGLGNLTLANTPLVPRTLLANPLTFTHGDTALKIRHRDHGMYVSSNNVTIAEVKSGLSTTLSTGITDVATTLTLVSGTNFGSTTGKFAGTVDSTSRWYIKINDEIMFFTEITSTAVSSLVRAQDTTTAVAHAAGSVVELYQLHKVPFIEINKTHTSIANIDIDSYSILLVSSPAFDGGAGAAAENGGLLVTATENHINNTGVLQLSTMELEGTRLSGFIRSTSATSVSGNETSFSRTTESNERKVPINDNYTFDSNRMIASQINETNEMGGIKSYLARINMASNRSNLSPAIDLQRCSWISVSNRINKIDSSADLASNITFINSTEPEGDNNAAIYVTKKVILENPATALKVILAANRPADATLKLMFKTLSSEDSDSFDDLPYTFFNTTGTSDQAVNSSLGERDFQEYAYSAGVTDDGIGDPLPEFISFSIKIIMQSTNMAAVPRLSDFRALALAL